MAHNGAGGEPASNQRGGADSGASASGSAHHPQQQQMQRMDPPQSRSSGGGGSLSPAERRLVAQSSAQGQLPQGRDPTRSDSAASFDINQFLRTPDGRTPTPGAAPLNEGSAGHGGQAAAGPSFSPRDARGQLSAGGAHSSASSALQLHPPGPAVPSDSDPGMSTPDVLPNSMSFSSFADYNHSSGSGNGGANGNGHNGGPYAFSGFGSGSGMSGLGSLDMGGMGGFSPGLSPRVGMEFSLSSSSSGAGAGAASSTSGASADAGGSGRSGPSAAGTSAHDASAAVGAMQLDSPPLRALATSAMMDFGRLQMQEGASSSSASGASRSASASYSNPNSNSTAHFSSREREGSTSATSPMGLSSNSPFGFQQPQSQYFGRLGTAAAGTSAGSSPSVRSTGALSPGAMSASSSQQGFGRGGTGAVRDAMQAVANDQAARRQMQFHAQHQQAQSGNEQQRLRTYSSDESYRQAALERHQLLLSGLIGGAQSMDQHQQQQQQPQQFMTLTQPMQPQLQMGAGANSHTSAAHPHTPSADAHTAMRMGPPAVPMQIQRSSSSHAGSTDGGADRAGRTGASAATAASSSRPYGQAKLSLQQRRRMRKAQAQADRRAQEQRDRDAVAAAQAHAAAQAQAQEQLLSSSPPTPRLPMLSPTFRAPTLNRQPSYTRAFGQGGGTGSGAAAGDGINWYQALLKVMFRPDAQIHLGPVDQTCSFTISDCALPDDPIIYCSQAFCELTGYEPSDIIGRNCRFLQAPDGQVEKGSQRTFTDEAAVAHLKKHVERRTESQASFLNYRKGGEAFVNLVTIVPIDLYDCGSITHLVGFQVDLAKQPGAVLRRMDNGSYAVDYTRVVIEAAEPLGEPNVPTLSPDERKRRATDAQSIAQMLHEDGEKKSAAAEALDDERWSEIILNNSSDLIWALSTSLDIAYVSPSITPLLGHHAKELIGQSLSVLLHPADAVQVFRDLKDVFRAQKEKPEKKGAPRAPAPQPASGDDGQATTDISRFPIRMKTASGEFRWFDNAGHVQRDARRSRRYLILAGRARSVYYVAPDFLNTADDSGGSLSGRWMRVSRDGIILHRVTTRIGQEDEFAASVGSSAKDWVAPESWDAYLEALQTPHPVVLRWSLQPGKTSGHLDVVSKFYSPLSEQPRQDAQTLRSDDDGRVRWVRTVATPADTIMQPNVVYPCPDGETDPHGAFHSSIFSEFLSSQTNSWMVELRQMQILNKRLRDEIQRVRDVQVQRHNQEARTQ